MGGHVVLRLVVVAALLAGCAQGPLPESAPSAPRATGGPTVWEDCAQWHLHFDARAQDFQGDVPPGFTVAADAQGLTTLLMHVTRCAGPVEAVIAVPVVAPPAREDPERQEIAVIQLFHNGHAQGVYPTPFAARLVEAAFDFGSTPTGPTVTITSPAETTQVHVVLAPSPGSFSAERWARVAANDTALGIVTVDGEVSSSVGFGPAAYVHQGPGGAPPGTAGIAHLIEGLRLTWAHEVVPQ